ncbi:alkylated DNA repair protein AlkB [Botrytis cinerea]
MSDAAVTDDLEIVDFTRGLTPEQQEKLTPVGIVPSELIAKAQKDFMNTGAEYNSGHPAACTIYEHSGFPGLRLFPALLPPETQSIFVSRLLHRELSNPLHKTNFHDDYDIPYPPLDSSFFTYPHQAKNQVFAPKDPNSKHKPLNAAQALQKKFRWLTLGSQYDWNTRAYPSSSPTPFPSDVSRLVTTLFQNAFTPESGVVLMYSTKDFMPVHRDVSEECERGLASFTLGCDGLFVISRDVRKGEEHIDNREQDLVCIRVRSGDVIQMGGETRWAWHAMPKIMAGTCPPCLETWPVGSTEKGKEPKEYERWRGYMKAILTMSTKIGKTFTSFRKLPLELRLMIWELAKPAGRIIKLDLVERSAIKEEWNLNRFPPYSDQYGHAENSDENPFKYNKLWGFKSKTTIPALLLACHESHAVASKWYPRVFQCFSDNPQVLKFPPPLPGPGSVSLPQTYFNFKEDTLFITPKTFQSRYKSENSEVSVRFDNQWRIPEAIISGVSRLAYDPDFSRIENLAIQINSDELNLSWDSHAEWLARFLERGFRDLKTLTVVIDYHVPSPRWRKTQGDACCFYHPDRPILEHEKTKWVGPKTNASYFTESHIRKVTQHMMGVLKEEHHKAGKLMWNLPEIQFKIVLPAKIKANLHRNVQRYKKKFDGWQREAASKSRKQEDIS